MSVAEALKLWQSGRRGEAEHLCERLATPDALSLLAEIYSATQRAPQELVALRRLVRLKPRDPSIWRRLGNCELTNNEPDAAVSSYRQAIDLEPHNTRGHNNLGQALMRLERYEQALASYRQATQWDAGYAIAHNNQGLALLKLRRPEEALACYQRALELNPVLPEALHGAAESLEELDRPLDALSYRERLLALAPDDADAQNNRGAALNGLGRHQEALACCDRALALRPDFAPALAGRAIALRALHCYEDARVACERALQLRPDFMPALTTLAEVLDVMGEQRAARDCLRRVLEINPQHVAARVMEVMALIPILPRDEVEVSAARLQFAREFEQLERWLQHSEVDVTEVVGCSTPFFIAYQELCNRDPLSRYGKMCCDLMSRWQQGETSRGVQRRVTVSAKRRVGIVSAHIRDHSVYRALVKGWIEQLDRERFTVGVIHLGKDDDAETSIARARADFFIDGTRSLQQWVEAIGALDLDVLIFPEIGMSALTVQLASLRLAAHQLASWGHPETTGIPTIDYYLSAQCFEPPEAQDYYSEKLVRLPNLGCFYEPYELPAVALDLRQLGIDTDSPILISPGMPFKYAPRHDAVLAAIAERLGRCQIVLFVAPVPSLTRRLHERLEQAFHARQLDPSRYLVLVPWQSPAEFFALMRRADVLLDTIGFSGFNTIIQAIGCGLPPVTYEGRFMRGRFGSGIAAHAGLPDLVARTADEYVDLATRLATDVTFRREVRARIESGRDRLFRDRAAITGLEALLAGLP